jgi:hypothetical protein
MILEVLGKGVIRWADFCHVEDAHSSSPFSALMRAWGGLSVVLAGERGWDVCMLTDTHNTGVGFGGTTRELQYVE